MSKRILVSSGFGAGWSTWADQDKSKAVAEYGPIIDYLDAGGPITSGSSKWAATTGAESWLHPDFLVLVEQMKADLNMGYFYTGGADGLTVETVEGLYMIEEYDGSESVRTSVDFW